MKEIVNNKYYKFYSNDAHQFYLKHGWVALTPQLSKYQLNEITNAWNDMVEGFAKEIGCNYVDYKRQISQWRNLWRHNEVFKKLLNNTSLWQSASYSLEQKSIRLLHDHIICKTPQSGNGEIPWHQDSMFWPVDRTGLSTWMPLDDVSLKSGCLEVIDASHCRGVQEPVDFMSPTNDFSDNNTIIKIPIEAGGVILLHSLTWHRSKSNSTTSTRPAHIALWVPSETRFSPKQAKWHPLIENIYVEPNEILNDDWFPCFGSKDMGKGISLSNNHKGANLDKPISMFGAREKIQLQIEELMGKKGNISELLRYSSERKKLTDKIYSLMSSELIKNTSREKISEIIKAVWISSAAYEIHRSRNVFNSAYAEWWDLIDKNLVMKNIQSF